MPPFYFLTFAKVSVSGSKKFGFKKVSVSVSKTFGLEKKSRYQSRKHLVSKKSLGIGPENIWSRKKVSKIFGLGKKSRSRSRKFWSRKKVSVSVSMKFFGLVTQWCLGLSKLVVQLTQTSPKITHGFILKKFQQGNFLGTLCSKGSVVRVIWLQSSWSRFSGSPTMWGPHTETWQFSSLSRFSRNGHFTC